MIISQHWLIPVVLFHFLLLIENMVASFRLANSNSDNQESSNDRSHTQHHHHHPLHREQLLNRRSDDYTPHRTPSSSLLLTTTIRNVVISSNNNNRTKSVLSQINHAGNPSTSNILSSYFVEQSWRSADVFESQREQFERDCVQNLRAEENESPVSSSHTWQCRVKAQRRKVTTLANNNIIKKPETDKPDLSVFTLKQQQPQQSQRLLEFQHKPLYCLCHYEYDCGVENEKFYFSLSYMNKLRAQNEQKGVMRGADYQCELALNRQRSAVIKTSTTSSEWTCQIKRSLEKASVVGDDEYYCDCFRHKKCKRQRLVDFY